MQVEFSPLAFDDLQNIGDHIAKDSPVNASFFVNGLIDRCEQIALAPDGYIERSEIADNIRSVAYRDYMIFYSATKMLGRIERILHGSRDYLNSDFL